MKITVFGGSSPKPGDQAYEQAYQLGKMLAEGGFTVLTGGYIGTMEAISRGASEQGGHVIGVTCDQIEQWRPGSPNAWVQEQMRFSTLKDRLYALIENCDGALVLPGGVGTLAELAVMWSQLQTRAISPRPLIFIGRGWKAVIEEMMAQFDAYIPEDHLQYLTYAPGIEQAFQLLNKQFKSGSG